MWAFVLSFLCMSCVYAALPDRDISGKVVTLFYSGGIVRDGRSTKANIIIKKARPGDIVPLKLSRYEILLGYLVAGMYERIFDADYEFASAIQLPNTIFYLGGKPCFGCKRI